MINVLILIVGIIFIAQVVRVFELSNLIKNNNNEVGDSSNHINGILLLISGIGLILFFFWQRAKWMGQTLQLSASEHGPIIDTLWDTTMGLIIVAFLLLTPMLFGIAFYFRGREDRKASYITHNNKLEFFWTAIPAVIWNIVLVFIEIAFPPPSCGHHKVIFLSWQIWFCLWPCKRSRI